MAFGAGSHSVKAVLASTHNYQSSTSSTVTFSVTGIPTTTALQTTGAYSLRATVVGNAKSTVGPTGTITVADLTKGNTSLGSASLGPSTPGQSLRTRDVDNFPARHRGHCYRRLQRRRPPGPGICHGHKQLRTGCPRERRRYVSTFGSLRCLWAGCRHRRRRFQPGWSDGPGGHPYLPAPGRHLVWQGGRAFFVGASANTGADPYTVTAADFNEDGILDLAVANIADATFSILLGNGDGSFTPAAAVTSGVAAGYVAQIADFNGDGHLDIFATNGLYGYTVLLGNGDGTFSSRSFLPPTGTYTQYGGSVAGDFNGDGIPDVIIEDLYDYLILLLGNGDGTFTQQSTTIPVGGGPRLMTSADLNRDGKLDVILADGTWGGLGRARYNFFMAMATVHLPRQPFPTHHLL